MIKILTAAVLFCIWYSWTHMHISGNPLDVIVGIIIIIAGLCLLPFLIWDLFHGMR